MKRSRSEIMQALKWKDASIWASLYKKSVSAFFIYCFHYPDSPRTPGRQPSYRFPLLSFKGRRALWLLLLLGYVLGFAWLWPALSISIDSLAVLVKIRSLSHKNVQYMRYLYKWALSVLSPIYGTDSLLAHALVTVSCSILTLDWSGVIRNVPLARPLSCRIMDYTI